MLQDVLEDATPRIMVFLAIKENPSSTERETQYVFKCKNKQTKM